MASKELLSELRTGTDISTKAQAREGKMSSAMNDVILHIVHKFGLHVSLERQMYLKDIVDNLNSAFPAVDFKYYFASSHMKPDGGILYIKDRSEKVYPILISEMKNQGTNDKRVKEGKKKQARGNAIERLGKNVIGFRTALMFESIFPFICFGDGCDFSPESSIIDRVGTIAMFSELNKIRVHNEGFNGVFNRGSFFFREKLWTPAEMSRIMIKIVDSAILYYFSKYGDDAFKKAGEETRS